MRKESAIDRSRRRARLLRDGRRLRESRACVRRTVALRVDYATVQGRVRLGLVRNLPLQGLSIDSALCHVAPEVAPETC
jgi:hypothetical protein